MLFIKNILFLFIPGVFHIKNGCYYKGGLIILFFSFFLFNFLYTVYKGENFGIQLFILLAFYLLIFIDVVNCEDVGLIEKNKVSYGKERNDTSVNDKSKRMYEEARIAMMTSDYKKAEELFLRLINENENDMDSVYQLGVVYYKMNRRKESEKWLKKYLKQKEHKKWLIDAERILGELKNDFKSS